MKKILTVALLTTTVLMGCKPGNQVTIQGNVEGLEGMVWLVSRTDGAIDSAKVSDGKFTIKTEMGPEVRMYIADNPSLMDAVFRLSIIMEPGTVRVERTQDMEQAKVSGTPANDGYAKYRTMIDRIEDQLYEVESDEESDSLEKVYYDLSEEAFRANTDNAAGLLFLRDMSYDYITGQALDDCLEGMPDALKDTKEWKTLKNTAEKQILTAVGQPYLDFSQPDAGGVQISLKSVLEKPGNRYVLLDFWASWCGPCMGEVPYMIQDYADFHDRGFEIFGSSLDMDRDSWLNAVKDKEMNWIHVSDVKYWENSAAKLYGVPAIPCNFLIDCRTGLIVARDLRGTELRKKLNELLNN